MTHIMMKNKKYYGTCMLVQELLHLEMYRYLKTNGKYVHYFFYNHIAEH